MTKTPSSLVRRVVRRALAASGITAAIMYGWWQTIESARTPVLPAAQLGTPLALGRVVLTPQSVRLRSAATADAPGHVVLSAKIENVTSETQPAFFEHPFRLITVQTHDRALGNPDITLLRDRQVLRQLQPRMPEDIEIVWPAPPGWESGALSITFFRQQFKLKDNLYGRTSWLGYSAAATLAATPEPAP